MLIIYILGNYFLLQEFKYGKGKKSILLTKSIKYSLKKFNSLFNELFIIDDIDNIIRERRKAEEYIRKRQLYVEEMEEKKLLKEMREQAKRERIAAKFATK